MKQEMGGELFGARNETAVPPQERPFLQEKVRMHQTEEREDLYTLSLTDVSQILPILGGFCLSL
ncbi:MAG: hypothetical protein H6661_04085 [Ardenticatenaceae bacterium]|nr:hypothetical protein [Ardenticatenaceae bacterium]